MDRDAAFSSEVPYSKIALPPADIAGGITAIDTIRALVDTSTKRGSKAVNSLNAIRDELSTARPSPRHFEGSPLKTLLDKTKLLTASEQTQVKAALANTSKRESWRLLGKAQTFVWSATLEEILLRNAAAENCVETTLVAAGALSAPLQANPTRRAALINKLHDAGNMPHILTQVVLALEIGGHFNRSEINECFKLVFPNI